jgi:hypothetical protein
MLMALIGAWSCVSCRRCLWRWSSSCVADGCQAGRQGRDIPHSLQPSWRLHAGIEDTIKIWAPTGGPLPLPEPTELEAAERGPCPAAGSRDDAGDGGSARRQLRERRTENGSASGGGISVARYAHESPESRQALSDTNLSRRTRSSRRSQLWVMNDVR